MRSVRRAGVPHAFYKQDGLFQTRDGRQIQIAASANPVFRRLCRVMQRDDWPDDERFATARARGRNQDVLAVVGSAYGRDATALRNRLAALPAEVAGQLEAEKDQSDEQSADEPDADAEAHPEAEPEAEEPETDP